MPAAQGPGLGSTKRPNVVTDGVLRYPPTGLKVLIVGAGVGGLFAAIECWRKGHDVEVIERADGLSPLGDTFVIGPSALVTLRNYPTMLEEYDKISYDIVVNMHYLNGNRGSPPLEYEFNRAGIAQHAAYPLRVRPLVSRPGAAKMLCDQAQRLGISVRFGITVVDYIEDLDTATAIAEDGRHFSADIVVAADGIGTKSHGLILGHPVKAISTGYATTRSTIPTDQLVNAPTVKRIIDELDRPELRLYASRDLHVVYCLSKEMISIGINRKDNGTATESWAQEITADEVLESLPDLDSWDPAIVEALRNLRGRQIVNWKLFWRDPQPCWTSPGGRLVQVGDSAHSFLPTSGMGASVALEDCSSIAECLRLGGKADAHVATKIHGLLRFQRVSLLQLTGFTNRQEFQRGMEDLARDKAASNKMLQMGKWVWGHDPEKYATDNFARARAHVESGAPFENTNLPPGHKWEPWTMEEQFHREKQGYTGGDLKTNGDWGSV